MRLFSSSIGLALTVTCSYVWAACDCGYTLNSTTDPDASYALFTELLETDFLHLYTLPDSISESPSHAVGWAPQAYNVSPSAARGPFGKSAEVENVVVNPLNKTTDWGGEGWAGGPPGLQIWVRGAGNLRDYVGSDQSEGGKMVRIGEIDSLREDVRYGTFRIGMKMSEEAGTCAAFFWYRNDTSELDIEFLSRQSYASNGSAKINLVIQSPLSASLGYNAAPTTTFSLHALPFLPDSDYHEYRFDWTPLTVSFWVDGVFLASFDQYDPDAPGRLMLNHWSNGDPNWSGGPPATDSVITISHIKAYFNSSDETRNQQWNSACANAWEGRTCMIPGFPERGISPLGPEGNVTGQTDFFIYRGDDDDVVNQTVYPAATATAVPGTGNKAILEMSYLIVLLEALVMSMIYL